MAMMKIRNKDRISIAKNIKPFKFNFIKFRYLFKKIYIFQRNERRHIK